MPKSKFTESQKRADLADYAKNKEARRHAAYRRQARLFIRSHAQLGVSGTKSTNFKT